MTDTEPSERPYLILGASHAGVALAAELRGTGHRGRIVLIGRESSTPYHRPHLSKESLEGEMPDPRPLRPQAFFADGGIEHASGVHATAIDRGAKRLLLSDGTRLDYARLFLATGARARRLTGVPGAERSLTLRHMHDWRLIAERLARARSLAVIGGGLIGLEVAAAARKRGVAVTVVEAGSRLMARSLYPALADYALEEHRRSGIDVILDAAVTSIGPETVHLADGAAVPAEVVLVAIGSEARDELARAAGLPVANGIVVDAHGATTDPAIHALGDCASWPEPGSGRLQRHESVAATQWQARCIAAALTGSPPPPPQVLRLWSTQGPMRFQMAGPVDAGATCRVSEVPGGLLLHASQNGRLTAVQALNASREFNAEVGRLGQPDPVATGAEDVAFLS